MTKNKTSGKGGEHLAKMCGQWLLQGVRLCAVGFLFSVFLFI
jgi:hypothetical protein